MKVRFLLAFVAAVGLLGCSSSKNPEKAFFSEVSSLSKTEVFARGEALMAKKKYVDARRFFSFLSDSFPNDPLGRQAALKVADSFFAGKDAESLTEAQLRYKDFSNRFPSDPARGYALLQQGKCSFQQKRGPLRDLAPIREATESFKQVVTLYPGSAYAKEAADLLSQCQEDLASHEIMVAKYYVQLGAMVGAGQRLDYALANYPNTRAVAGAGTLIAQVRKSGVEVGKPVPAAPKPTGQEVK
jgi:outer membrane protein assembly factor BamD